MARRNDVFVQVVQWGLIAVIVLMFGPALFGKFAGSINSALASFGTKSPQVPGTGFTADELARMGYTAAQIAEIYKQPSPQVPGTGFTADELFGMGYSPEQLAAIYGDPSAYGEGS